MNRPTTGHQSALTVQDDGGPLRVCTRRTDTYQIHIVAGLVDQLGALLKPVVAQLDAPGIVVLADTGTAAQLPGITRAITQAGVVVHTEAVPAGETSKSVTGLHRLWQRLHHNAASRRTLLIGVGGGVTCDLVTAAAATYMRGLPYALIPTTLLAQLDAAVGGKGGIDYQSTKNLLGAFHHPAAVFIDPDLTRTLPDRHLRNGLAEALKVALIADPALFTTLATGIVEAGASLTGIVRAAVTAKLRLLADDPFEQGDLRRLLNLGHCIGHPLEAATAYQMLHGEAVAAGIAAAAAISHRLGLCAPTVRDQILAALTRHRLPATIDDRWADPIFHRLDAIRRIRNGPLHLVVPQQPGHCTVLADLDRATFDAALADLRAAHDTSGETT